MRSFLKLSYNGAAFHGWQAQPNAASVQQTVEEALGILLRSRTPLTGAGRTDAGVHARTMYAHFDHDGINDPEGFLRALNRLCGHDIAINALIPVSEDAHARFDATERSYKYFITFVKNPFTTHRAWMSPTPLDKDAMNEAATLLTRTSDFTSFAKLHSDTKTNICKVTEAKWTDWESETGKPGIVFTITADRFLRNMVRAVVGTLVETGRGKLDTAGFMDIIEKRDRCCAGTSMPAQGLFLWDVKYPYLNQ